MFIKGLLDIAERVRDANDVRQQQAIEPGRTSESRTEMRAGNSQSEEFPKPFSLCAANGDLGLLPVVHS